MADAFISILNGLQSTDNTERTQSETTYDAISPKERLELLLKTLCLQNIAQETRGLAAVLLRRILVNQYEQSFEELVAEQQAAVKMQLLQCIVAETSDQVRRKVADAAAEMARNQYDAEGNQTWPEYTAFIVQAINEGSQGMPEIALHMFAAVPSVFIDEHTPSRLTQINSLLAKCMAVGLALPLRSAAAKATAAFVTANEDDSSVLAGMAELLPGLLQAVVDNVQNEDDALLKLLVEIAETAHRFLRPQLENVIALCMSILSNEQLADTARHLALEVLVTLSEQAAASVRKFGRFIGELVPLVLKMMTELEDEDDWSVEDEVDDADETSSAITGETALDRLACGLGGKTVLPHILATLPDMLKAADWKTRHAALMAVSACGEGCHKQMEGMLESVLDAILPFLADAHPRVRYATCNALGQMSTDFGPALQKKFHAKIVPGLLAVLDDFAHPRVQAHAAAAVVNFSEACPKAIMALYLDGLMAKLEHILSTKFTELVQKGNKCVLEQVVTTIASVADSAEEAFCTYYDRFMPCLKYIMENAVQPELRMLRGKAIECISLIGLAVGREKFLPDAASVMDLLLATQRADTAEVEADDPQMSYMISGWARMCKIMGPAFEPYLPSVMPMVLKAAQIKPDVCVMDNEEVEGIEQDPEWQFIRLGDEQNFAIRTSGLEDKATACQMLVCYARELKTAFAPWVEQVTQIMLPLLKFYFHDEVRSAAAESLPFLLDSAQVNGDAYVTQMWRAICPELLKALEGEPETEVLADHLYAVAQCVERVGINCFTVEEFQQLAKQLDRLLTEHFDKAAQRLAKRSEEDHDDVEEERLHEEGEDDTYVLAKIADIVHALFGTHKAALLGFFQQLAPHFTRLLGDDRPWQDWQWGICVFDDVVEHADAAAVPYLDVFLPRLMQCLLHPEADCRQAAIYGLGVMAQKALPEYLPALQQGLLMLTQQIAAPDARSVDNVQATENAISTVTKMMKYAPSVCAAAGGVDALLPAWFGWLPMHEDVEEVEHVYGYLCELVEANHPVVLNDLPRLVAVLAETFAKEGLNKEGGVYLRCLNIVRQIQTDQNMFMQCLLKLSEEQKTTLSKALEASST